MLLALRFVLGRKYYESAGNVDLRQISRCCLTASASSSPFTRITISVSDVTVSATPREPVVKVANKKEARLKVE